MYWVLFFVALGISLYAQSKVMGAYRKYSQVPNRRGLTGAQVAASILHGYGTDAGIEPAANTPQTHSELQAVAVQRTPGMLSDHYDPRQRVLRLSDTIYSGQTIAAVSVAAHEAGHAIQHAANYPYLGIRSLMVPVANIGSQMAMPIVLIGALLGQFRQAIDIAIVLYIGVVAFTLLTLPVEFNASRRALKILDQGGYLVDEQEKRGAKSMLNAAAFTYVAATIGAVISLLQLFLMRQASDE